MSSIEEETPSMKGNNQLEKRLNTIRQRSNSLWKECSRKYSRFLWTYLRIILPLSLILTVGLSGYFFAFMRVRPFDQEDFLLRSTETFENGRRLREIFGDDSTLRTHQQLQLHPALDVIIKRKVSTDVADANETNMLDEKIFDEVSTLNALIQSIVVQSNENGTEFNYSSLCVRRNHACMIEGNYLLSQTFRQALTNLLPPSNGYYVDNHGANGIPEFMFGKNYRVVNATPAVSDYEDEEIDGKSLDEILQTTTTGAPELVKIISHVPLFRLRYSLQSSTPESKHLALQWERKAFEFLTEAYRSSSIEVAVSTSKAIGETVAKKAHEEGLFLAFTLLFFFVFVNFFSSIEGNRLTSLGLLPICGFIGIVLSSGATFGLLTLFQVQLIEPMVLIVFGVAIFESMRISIVCGEYHRVVEEHLRTLPSSSATISAEAILSSVVESTHPFFLVTTLSLALVYFLLATFTPMVPSMLICLTLALHLLITYLVHSTFFSSCLVLTLRRVAARRHCFSCQRLSSEPEENFLSARKFPSPLRIDSISKRFISAIFCLLAIVGLFFSVWFTLSIETRLFDDAFLPADASSLRSYMKSQMEDFDIGPVVMFTVPQPVDYADSNVRQAMSSLLEQCQNENRINDFRLFWLDHENLDVILHEKTPLEFRILPFSQNDLVVKEENNESTIVASRFYCQYRSLQGDREDIRTMNNIYADAKQSSLPSVFPYSLIFPSYESLAQIRFDTYLLVLLVIVVPFFLTFISFVWLKVSLSIAFHALFLFASTLAVLYQFHRFTFNFANAMWLLILPVLFVETLVHTAFFHRQSRWKYNRVFLSLIISLIILYVYPIQSYVFLTIRNSLMYQSVICLILINFLLPSSHYLLLKPRNAEVAVAAPIQMTTVIPEGQQSLTGGIEVQSETALKMKSAI